jgi:radical SAM protein with 4Fe4S-binding SPASM domain
MLAEMDDKNFRLGNLHSDRYEDVMGGDRMRAIVEHSCSETLPGCSECAFVPFCGADPVFHWATQGDLVGHRPTSAFCQKNMTIIRYLLDLVRGDDTFTRQLLTSWAVR